MAKVRRYTRGVNVMLPEEIFRLLEDRANRERKSLSEITREIVLYAIKSLGWDKEIKKEEQFNMGAEP